MFDAYLALKEVAENGGDLRQWAEKTAALLGEETNLDASWPVDENNRCVVRPL